MEVEWGHSWEPWWEAHGDRHEEQVAHIGLKGQVEDLAGNEGEGVVVVELADK